MLRCRISWPHLHLGMQTPRMDKVQVRNRVFPHRGRCGWRTHQATRPILGCGRNAPGFWNEGTWYLLAFCNPKEATMTRWTPGQYNTYGQMLQHGFIFAREPTSRIGLRCATAHVLGSESGYDGTG